MKFNTKSYSIILCILFLVGAAFSTSIQSDQGLSEDEVSAPEIVITHSDRSSVVFSVVLHGFNLETEEIQGEYYHKLSLPDYGYLDTIGKAKLPAIRLFFAVPPEVNDVQISVLDSEYSILQGYNVIPVQTPIPEDESNDDFNINTSFYTTDDFYPQHIIYAEHKGWIRDYQFIQVTLTPIQFNPSTKELKIFNVSQFEIQFQGSKEGEKSLLNPGFESLYEQLFLNFETSQDWYQKQPRYSQYNTKQNTSNLLDPSNGAGCLIITHDNFYNCIQPLATWKDRKGFNTFIANTSLIYTQFPAGSNLESIRDFIAYTFTDWAQTPSHILLIGDVEYVPTYYYDGDTPSDHWYSCVIGGDYYSDILVGRISVKNCAEVSDICEKIINYEKNPYINETDWYKKGMLVSDSGYFETTSDWVYNFLINFNYTLDKFYASQGTASTSNIANAINDGRAIANYRGHGSTNGWATGSFYNSDVLSLTNGRKLPIVISPTCSSGHFDDSGTDCFGEAWLKATDKGGVSFWGSSRVSYGGYNDELDMGVYKAIFNDHIYDFGGFTNKAKIYMTDVYGFTSMAILEIHLFNVIGDSTLEFWSEVPQPLNVTHPMSFPAQNAPYLVTVNNGTEPIEDACVVLEKDPDMYMVGFTDASGQVQFDLENITLGTFNITVTAHNYIPYLGNTSVYNLMTIAQGWNFISFPFNQSIEKQNISIRVDKTSYDWQSAVLAGIISDYIFGWDRSSQSYSFSNSVKAGHGFWMYAYEDAEIQAHSTKPVDVYITTLSEEWNTIGLPYYQNQSKDGVMVQNSSAVFTWSQAVTSELINNYMFGWDSMSQSYSFSDTFIPGNAYWLYAYQSCVLKREV